MNDHGSSGVVFVSLLDLGANSGGPRRSRQLARLFATAGARVHLIGYRSPDVRVETIAAALAADGVTTTLIARDAASVGHRLRYTLGRPWSAAEREALLREIRAAVATTRADALVLYNQDAIAARVMASLCQELRVAFVQQYAEAHVAADFPLGPLNGRWRSERAHLQSAPRLARGHIVISRWLEEAVRARGGLETLLLPSFVDVEEWEQRFAASPPSIASGEPHLVYVGDGARRDCLPLISEALGLVRQCGFLCRASFVGVASADGVECFPRAAPAQLAAHYRSADAFILLRTDDQSSRACLPTRLGELLLTGRPVIVSDLPDYNRYVRDHENGYVVRAASAAAVADAIQAALPRTSHNAEIGRCGRATALERFDWRAYRGEVASWLTRVVKPKT